MKYTQEQIDMQQSPIFKMMIFNDVNSGKISMSCGKELLGFSDMNQMRYFMENFNEVKS